MGWGENWTGRSLSKTLGENNISNRDFDRTATNGWINHSKINLIRSTFVYGTVSIDAIKIELHHKIQ